ncbi:sulfhydryl oxidase 1 [Gracilinanus agilis]|uniref:sulfhydryl oxidase 1 n=1 Tax=Gracilinanus agilis TaxID=191870 RepID=UPI001CFED312|nr:sulfhydryl oxidase 1 [Gracilinanus agilis]
MGKRGRCSAATVGPDFGSGALSRLLVLLLLAALLVTRADAARVRSVLYSPSDSLMLLGQNTLRPTVLGSPSSWVVEFFASWCGHCIAFAPKWKALANEVKDWTPVLNVAALDCADEANSEICRDFGITAYPTVKFFKAYSNNSSTGKEMSVFGKSVEDLQQMLIDGLESHRGGRWPPSCPPLAPIRSEEIIYFFSRNPDDYLALIFEKKDSYVGREVELDLSQYHGIKVRRVLDEQEEIVKKFDVTVFPSCYLLTRNGSRSRVPVLIESRSLYSTYLQRLPGVVKRTFSPTVKPTTRDQGTPPIRKFADSSKIYMSDLESSLHYILRVEVGKFKVLEGQRLTALKNFMSVLAKYYPGQPLVRNFLHSMDVWLQWQQRKSIPYSSLEAALNNRREGAVLPKKLTWVGCQGSEPHFRGFPCSLWILFHSLTVQAAQRNEYLQQKGDPQEILQAIRGYVKYFFGCRDCANHFEQMAAASMDKVKSMDDAILWFWNRHNRVNARLAGTASEDPRFPKIQWPPRDLCNSCHNEVEGDPVWNLGAILAFLKSHFSARNIVYNHSLSVEALGRWYRELDNSTSFPPVEEPNPTELFEEKPRDGFEEDLRKEEGHPNEETPGNLAIQIRGSEVTLKESDGLITGNEFLPTEWPEYYRSLELSVGKMKTKELQEKQAVPDLDAHEDDEVEILNVETESPISDHKDKSLLLDDGAKFLDLDDGTESLILEDGVHELFPRPKVSRKLSKRDTLSLQLEEGAEGVLQKHPGGSFQYLASFNQKKSHRSLVAR